MFFKPNVPQNAPLAITNTQEQLEGSGAHIQYLHRPLLSITCFLLEKIQQSQLIQMETIGKIC
ncbi:hypothetical protein L208DRAFT_1394720 [Tricholoma matsutake]|nr:hypothetical protein L208DRAFT_1394720 [Tricholoma matsutake 945]